MPVKDEEESTVPRIRKAKRAARVARQSNLQQVPVSALVARLHGWKVGDVVTIPPMGRCVVSEIF